MIIASGPIPSTHNAEIQKAASNGKSLKNGKSFVRITLKINPKRIINIIRYVIKSNQVVFIISSTISGCQPASMLNFMVRVLVLH